MNKNSRFEVAYQEGDALIKGLKMVLVDKETGVNYLFVQSGYAGGLTLCWMLTVSPLLLNNFGLKKKNQ